MAKKAKIDNYKMAKHHRGTFEGPSNVYLNPDSNVLKLLYVTSVEDFLTLLQ